MQRTYNGFDEQVLVEQRLMDGLMAKRGNKIPSEWVQECNDVIQAKLKAISARAAPVRIVPATPVDIAQTQPDTIVTADREGHYQIPNHQASGIPSAGTESLRIRSPIEAPSPLGEAAIWRRHWCSVIAHGSRRR